MELRYENLKDKPEAFLAFTGLNTKEFQILLQAFTLAWELYVQQNSLPPDVVPPINGRKELRQRDYGGGRKARLSTCEEKLLFILVYFKIYPLQEVLAFHFDMSQSQACEWIHILSEVLRMSLKELGHIPERDAQKVKELLEPYMDESVECGKVGKKNFAIDGTERRRQRPKDQEEQKRFYSGKKKAHTVKNNVIVTLGHRKVEYLGCTWEGKKHDKNICDEEGHEFPEGSTLYKDTGFQGYEPAGVDTRQPKKKPRGGELTDEEKEQNSLISKMRIIVEHVICGIKRCRIVKDVFRNTKDMFDDLVMEIACGLHNFRTEQRTGNT